MSNQSYNIVYQVPGMSQPTAMSCWATSFAMLINYLQGTQYTPDDIAQAFGLNVTACACYNIDGWAQLLGSYGPLYIGINGNTHAVLITGLTSDGTEEGTTFYINDPWDGAVSKNYATLTQIYENIDNETEFWIAHQ